MSTYLYAWEGIACIAVMMFHCPLPGEIGHLMRALARFAVPLFFAVSGKFLMLQWRKAKDAATLPENDDALLRAILKKRVWRTSRTFLFVLAVYTVYSFFWYLTLPGGDARESLADWFFMKYHPSEWLRLLIFNTGTVIYDGSVSYDHLWYLLALLYVLGIFCAFGKKLLSRAGILAPVMLVLCYAVFHAQRRYSFYILGIHSGAWYFLRNWLFFGLPFVLLGAALARTRTGKKGIWIALAGFLLTYLEYRHFGPMEVYLGSLVTVVGALTGGVTSASDEAHVPDIQITATARLKDVTAFLGQHCARHVYYWHMLVYSALIRVLALLPGNLHARPATGWVLPLTTYGLTIAAGVGVHSFLRKRQ